MAERRLPFPRPGERLVDGLSRPERVVSDGGADDLRAMWKRLGLTHVGGIALGLVGLTALGVLGLGLVGSERDGGNPLETGVAVLLAVVVAGILGGLVIALDAGFRKLRVIVRGR